MHKILEYLEKKYPVAILKDELVTLNVNTAAGKARFTELVAEIKATEKIISDCLSILNDKSSGNSEGSGQETGDRVDTTGVRTLESEEITNQL